MNFNTIQFELDNLSKKQIVHAVGFKSSTSFLQKMHKKYKNIRKFGIAQVDGLLTTKYKDSVAYFKSIKPSVDRRINNTDDLEFNKLFFEIEAELKEFTNFLVKINALKKDVRNYALMQKFLQDISNKLVFKDIASKVVEFEQLIVDVQSQLDFFTLLNQYIHLAKRYPTLKNEVNTKPKQLNKRNYSGLVTSLKKDLLEVQTFTTDIDNTRVAVRQHSLMVSFIKNLNEKLNTLNYNTFYQDYTKTKLSCEADLRYHNGWTVGKYHCYGNGLIYDSATKLYWYVIPNNAKAFTEISDKIEGLNNSNFNGLSSWRLPVIEELDFYDNYLDAGFLPSVYWSKSKANYWQKLKARSGQKFENSNDAIDMMISFFFIISLLPIICIFINDILCLDITKKTIRVSKKDTRNSLLIVSEEK